jgi:DNA polymerase I-like protein with 3'-5' exonuclease and polymerase domains
LNYIVLDFETFDPNIKLGRGSGWPEKQAKFLCGATLRNGDLGTCLHKTFDLLEFYLETQNQWTNIGPLTIVAHNAQYEAGILHSYGFDIESVTWIDTMILAKLFYNNLDSYGLDALAKTYLGKEKTGHDLGQVAVNLGLVKSFKSFAKPELMIATSGKSNGIYVKDDRYVVPISDPIQIAYNHMDQIYAAEPEIVHKYNREDVELCHSLFKYFMYDENGVQRFTQEVIDFHSDLIKALTLSRARGVRVHIPTAHRIKRAIQERQKVVELEIAAMTSAKFNINSSKQLAEFFESEGVEVPRTEKGNPSITKDWLAEVEHPLGKQISETKKLGKLVRDFIEPALELASEGQEHIRVYPEIRIYGAAATGRASCANPNLQQVPKRDKEFGGLIRKMYHPEDGDDWYSLDFSSQEPRLQVHYAAKIGAQGADVLVKKFHEDLKHDLHHQVACLIHGREVEKKGKERNDAKAINLGLSYGMGNLKLALSLGFKPIIRPRAEIEEYVRTHEYGEGFLNPNYQLGSVIELENPELFRRIVEHEIKSDYETSLKRQGKVVADKFNASVPFLGTLDKYCKKLLKARGHIKTVSGRKLYNETGFEFKALNKLIQGSAADQTWKSIVECYRQGIIITIPVHDELNISSNSVEVANKVKEIMETCVELLVPSYTEVQSGKSWGELK